MFFFFRPVSSLGPRVARSVAPVKKPKEINSPKATDTRLCARWSSPPGFSCYSHSNRRLFFYFFFLLAWPSFVLGKYVLSKIRRRPIFCFLFYFFFTFFILFFHSPSFRASRVFPSCFYYTWPLGVFFCAVRFSCWPSVTTFHYGAGSLTGAQ